MCFLGLDYGDKTIGVAACREGRVAVGVETIRRAEASALRASLRRLGELITQYEVQTIVLGFPKNMNNSLSERCEKTLLFKEKLERRFKAVKVVLWDERLSTAAVMRARPKRNDAVDEMAAVYILQGYLNQRSDIMAENQFDDPFDFEDEDSAITMFDDEGNETKYNVLASKQVPVEGGVCLYLLVVEADVTEPEDGGEAVAEVLHFKCVSAGDVPETEEEEMIFELVDEDHEDFEKVLELFKDDYQSLDIDIGE